MRDYIEEHFGVVDQSKQFYYDLMMAGGMSYHKSEKKNPKRDETLVLARREEIKKVEHHREEIEKGEMVVLLEDECHLLWGDCCGYVWGKCGAGIEVLMTNERG